MFSMAIYQYISIACQNAVLCCNGLKQFADEKINTLQNDKILDVTKVKAFADDKINVAQMMISVFGRVDSMWEKEKMLFSKGFFLWVIKSLDCMVKS